jgi:hypothetical protein
MSKFQWLLIGAMIGLFVLICFSGCAPSTFNELNIGEVLPLPNDEYGIVIKTPTGYSNVYILLTSDGQKRVSVKDVEKFKAADYDYVERHFDFDIGFIIIHDHILPDELLMYTEPAC